MSCKAFMLESKLDVHYQSIIDGWQGTVLIVPLESELARRSTDFFFQEPSSFEGTTSCL